MNIETNVQNTLAAQIIIRDTAKVAIALLKSLLIENNIEIKKVNSPGTVTVKHKGPQAIPVDQIDPQTNDTIASFDSATEAGKATGIYSGNISNVVRGDGKTAGGYIWRRTDGLRVIRQSQSVTI